MWLKQWVRRRAASLRGSRSANPPYWFLVESDESKDYQLKLIGNHFLTKDSIVFIDEPESGLHPGLLIELLDIIGLLASYGMQFFIASHS